MYRVLLIYDDYTELNTVEFSLKKVGFDVISITSEFALQEKILSFNPEIVIAYGRGPKVTTVGVGKRLKEMTRWSGKSLMIFPNGVKPEPHELIRIRMDLLLEAPVQTVRLIQILAKMTNQDDQALVEKLIKAAATDSTEAAGRGANRTKENDNVFIGGKLENQDENNYLSNDTFTKNENVNVAPFTMDKEIEKIGSGEDKIEPTEALVGKARTEDAKKNQFTLNPELQKSSESSQFNTEKPFISEEESFFSQSSDSHVEKEKDPFLQMKKELEEKSSREGKNQGDKGLKDQFAVSPLEPPELVDPHYQKEIDEARNGLSKRTKAYSKFTKDLRLNKESSLQRLEVRKEQNKLSQDWDPKENEEQDSLRRKFTNALFKK